MRGPPAPECRLHLLAIPNYVCTDASVPVVVFVDCITISDKHNSIGDVGMWRFALMEYIEAAARVRVDLSEPVRFQARGGRVIFTGIFGIGANRAMERALRVERIVEIILRSFTGLSRRQRRGGVGDDA